MDLEINKITRFTIYWSLGNSLFSNTRDGAVLFRTNGWKNTKVV